MNDEELKLGAKEKLKTTINSYMSKEEFLAVLKEIDFKSLKSCSIDLITDFIYDSSKDEITTRIKSIIVN